MIVVKLNNEKYRIKPASQLSVLEYIKLSEIAAEKEETKQPLTSIDYLSVVTGLKFAEIAKSNQSNQTSRRLDAIIGDIVTINDFNDPNYKIPNEIIIDGCKYNLNNIDTNTFGVRVIMESASQMNIIELYVHCLALLLTADYDYDYDKLTMIKAELMESNYIDTLYIAAFFFSKVKEWLSQRAKIISETVKTVQNKNSEIIKTITGGRMDKFSSIVEITNVCNNFNIDRNNVLKLSDIEVTYSYCAEIIQGDVSQKFNEHLQNKK